MMDIHYVCMNGVDYSATNLGHWAPGGLSVRLFTPSFLGLSGQHAAAAAMSFGCHSLVCSDDDEEEEEECILTPSVASPARP